MIQHWRNKDARIPSDWDFFRVNSKRLPGRVAELNCETSTAVSNVKSKGVNGPRQKSEGNNGGTMTLALEVATRQQVEEIDAAIEPLRVTNDEAFKTPIRVDHPIAYFHRIEYISSAKITSAMPQNGRWTVTIEMIQWFPPEEKTKANGTGKPAGDGGPLGDTTVPPPDPANKGASFP